jgi:hypothetical protein
VTTLTDGVVSRVKDGMISIKTHQQSTGMTDGTSVLLIRSKSNFLRVLPVRDEVIAKVCISLKLESFVEMSKDLYEQVKQLGIHLIHSTGFCPMATECLWEGYFGDNRRDKIEDLANWLRARDSVHEVSVLILK